VIKASVIGIAAAGLLLVLPSVAQQRPAAPRQAGSAGGVYEIGKAGAWSILRSGEGRAKQCIVAAQPAERSPRGLQRDPARVYISVRQGEASKPEFTVITGYPVKQGADVAIAVGAANFPGVGQSTNVWLKNPAEEQRLIGELRKGSTMSITGTSQRGNETVDRYPLTGFGQALERAQKECS
jgi:invasion protein IalB